MMKRVYSEKNPKYIDMSSFAKNQLAYFYAVSGKVSEAKRFFKSHGKDVDSNLIALGIKLKDQAKLSLAKNVLLEARKLAEREESKIAIDVELLHVFDRFGLQKSHYDTVRRLLVNYKENKLSNSQYKKLLFHVESSATKLYKQAVEYSNKKVKKGVYRIKIDYAIKYYNILTDLKKEKDYLYNFQIAEMYYVDNNCMKALDYYDKSYERSIVANNKKIKKLSFEGMIACLGKVSNKKSSVVNDYYVKYYTIYVSKNRNSKKTIPAFRKLFSIHFANNSIDKSEYILQSFRKYHPRKVKIQEEMLAKVMDYHVANKNNARINFWLKNINKGKFVVNKEYRKKLDSLVLSIKFKDADKLSENNKKHGIKKYLEIYRETRSDKVRKRIAFNIASSFYEIDNNIKSFEWANKALNLMSSSDIKKYEQTFLLFSKGLFDRRLFKRSAYLYNKLLEKLCKTPSKYKDIMFKNSSLFYLETDNINNLIKLLNLSGNCGISKKAVSNAHINILKTLIERSDWNNSLRILKIADRHKYNWSRLIYISSKIYYSIRKPSKAKKEAFKYYNYSKNSNKKREKKDLDVIANYLINDLKKEIKLFQSLSISYPIKKLTDTIQKKVKLLARIKSMVKGIYEIKTGSGYIHALFLFNKEVLENFIDEVRNFKPPTGKENEYKQISLSLEESLVKSLSDDLNNYRTIGKDSISKGNIFSKYSYYFMQPADSSIFIKYFPLEEAVTMDKRGKM